ncbi:MAG: ATP-binding protein [Phascolarctobacterium sp.]|nr:ATP-binding protein [Phascolarctobacterium sp.]
MRKFINRTNEMQTLEKEFAANRSSLVIIYGRRRVGKTSLINEFLKQHHDSIYFLATEESEEINKKDFQALVAEYTGNELLATAQVDWSTIFKTLVTHSSEEKKIVVIDEFQYLGLANAAFPSVLHKIWDTILKDANIMLILCGSLVSLMKSQTLDYSSPLYGRRTAQIKLKQIPFKYYHEFYENLSARELVLLYAVTGGVPKYIESFAQGGNIYEAIQENILNPQSYLYEEPYFLLQKEVSEIGSYFSLIKSIAFGNRKLADIASAMGVKQTSVTKYLNVLMDLDLIVREVPVTEAVPEKSKSGQYRITDNFIAFWFKFVYPYRAYLERGETDYVLSQIKAAFIPNFAAFVYEDIAREKMWDYASADTWPFRFNKLGRAWTNKTGEIDILAIDTIGKHFIIGECKYTKSPKGLSVLHSIEEKLANVKNVTGIDDAYIIIFSTAGFTQGLLDAAQNNPRLLLKEDLHM